MKRITLVSIVLLLAALAGGWFLGRPAYRHYKEHRATEEAKEFFAKAQYRNASLSARRALSVNPGNIEATKLVAQMAELSGSPSALDWWRRLAELSPTTENKLSLVSSALRWQSPPYPLASVTLSNVADSAKGMAAYHALSAQLDIKLNRLPAAIGEFEQALSLEPTNHLHELNLGVLRLASTNAETTAQGRRTLESLQKDPKLGAIALRSLVSEAVKRGDLGKAEAFSRQLVQRDHVAFEDRLLLADVLQRAKKPEFKEYLGSIQKIAVTNKTAIYATTAWMIGHSLADDALSWLETIPAKLRAEQPVPLAFVDCYEAKQNWGAMDAFLQNQNWGDLDFMRFALLSRAAAQQKVTMAVQTRWGSAVREAGNRLDALKTLLSMARKWGWEQEREDILWQILQRFPRERWVLGELQRSYTHTGNTRGLNKVFTAMASYEPANDAVRNNLAATALLLNTNLSEAHKLAKEAFDHFPTNATIASTFAYSLYLQGKTRAGLDVLERLNPEALQKPSVALYYGVLLSAAGETNQACKYLSLVREPDLLPEEKALLATAQKK